MMLYNRHADMISMKDDKSKKSIITYSSETQISPEHLKWQPS